MPVIRFDVRELERLLDKPVDRDELATTIPMLGADIDHVEGDDWAVEFFPDRPDLFTVEGIARALRAWYGLAPGLSAYSAAPASSHVTVEKAVEAVRPFIACAWVRGVTITQARLDALIDLQEDLHWGLGARRRRVAIGIHDASVLAPPFTYKAVKLDEHPFVPLQETREMTPRQILADHPKGKDYAHLLAGHDEVPLIVDNNGGVVSLPPIINADRTSVTTATRDLFLDVTGTDEWAVMRTLNLLATTLAEAGGQLESVEVRRADGTLTTPLLAAEVRQLSVAETNALLGTTFDADEVASRLRRMGYGAAPSASADGPGGSDEAVAVEVPCYRSDILHAWDLIEDVAIGHGIDTFDFAPTRAPTSGAWLPENDLAEDARESLVGLGYLEAMSLALSNERDQFVRMRRAPTPVVRVKNPVTEDHTLLRPALLPNLLMMLRKNAHRDLPQRVFEVGMVSHIDADGQVVEARHVAGAIIAGRSNFSEMKGVVQALARDLGWEGDITIGRDAAFYPGRCAQWADKGAFGEVHPEVLAAFGLSHPVAAFEFMLAPGPREHVRGPGDA